MRLWIDTPYEEPEEWERLTGEEYYWDSEKQKEINEKIKKIPEAKIVPDARNLTQFSLVTEDFQRAKELVKEIGRIYETLPAKASPEVYPTVAMQPECPECGSQGRFSDVHCSICGAELGRGKVELETFETKVETEKDFHKLKFQT